MRADRLVSLVLLLRQRGRLTADVLAAELEVSTRTVLRDVEALSAAGVPVYAERGRHGGYALLPGFRTELTGLTHEEALALVAAATDRAGGVLGLGGALASGVRKVVDALPADGQHRAGHAARRLLVDPETDLLSRRLRRDEVPDPVMAAVRSAVLDGFRLDLTYASRGQQPRGQVVDPVGLVMVRDTGYLLATEAEGGIDRTYRLARIHEARVLPEPARRDPDVDLAALWAERCARFLSEGHVEVVVRVSPGRRDQLLDLAEAVRVEETTADGWYRVEASFQDLWHAEWALWQLGVHAEAVAPPALRESLRARAQHLLSLYDGPS